MAADDHAIVVGINSYSSTSLRNLEGAVNDARATVEWLSDPVGGDVPLEQIQTVTSAEYPGEPRPVAADIHRAFENLIDLGDQRSPERLGKRLYVFMSGHGFGPSVREAALLMANAGPKRWGHNVCGGAVADHFAAEGLFEEIFLVMDCCRDSLSQVWASLLPWHSDSDASGRPATTRWIYGFATGFNSRTREIEIDGETRGVFNTAVLEALRSGVQNWETLTTLVGARIVELLGPDESRKPFFQPGPEKLEVGSAAVKPKLRISVTGTPGKPTTICVGPGQGEVREEETLESGQVWEVDLESGLWEIFYEGLDESVRVKLTMGTQDVTIEV
jgi:hypothetical protein